MHEKIKAILPKEKVCPNHEVDENGQSTGVECYGYDEMYNKLLAEVHAKIPEIVALVEGEVKINILQDLMLKLKQEGYCTCVYTVNEKCIHNVFSNLLMEAAFGNKK